MPAYLTPRLPFGLLLSLVVLGSSPPGVVGAEARPTAMALFPTECVLFVRSSDAGLLVDRAKQTAMIQMVQDPGLAPLVGSLEQSAREAYAENAEGLLGVDFDRLTNLPQGEVAFAIVERRNESPALLLLADFNENVETAQMLLDKAKETVQADGGLVSEEQLRADTAVTLRDKNDANRTIGVVRREGVFVAATDPAVLSSVLDRWDGFTPPVVEPTEDEPEPGPPLYSEKLDRNKAFATSLKECLGGRSEPPQVLGFVDPIGLVRATNGQNTGVRVGLAALPALGVDAFEGASFAAWLASDTWDTLIRGHLLIDNPRAGVAGILRLQSGDTTPPNCVPAEIQTYSTLHVNPQQIFDDIEAVVDRFTYEGMFREQVKKNFSDNVGVDLPSELLPALTGRVSTVGAFVPDAQSPVMYTMLILGVQDEEAARALLDKAVAAQKGDANRKPVKKTHGAFTYYGPPDADDQQRRPGPPMTPVAAVFDGALVLGGSEEILKQMMATSEGTLPRLQDSLEFKLVQSRIRRLAGANEVGMLSYEDPEASLRHWYAMATDPQNREWLNNRDQPFMAAINRALEAGELPPVEDLLKYNTPSGALVYDSDTGLHYLAFRFKVQE